MLELVTVTTVLPSTMVPTLTLGCCGATVSLTKAGDGSLPIALVPITLIIAIGASSSPVVGVISVGVPAS